jgi:isopentenyl-diphosphate Delta-isomerase
MSSHISSPSPDLSNAVNHPRLVRGFFSPDTPVMSDIEQRKRDHIAVILSGKANHARPAGFDDISFVHNALPEIDLDSVDLSTRFLGKTLRLPYLASSMTGGPDLGGRINAAIAEAAQQTGFAMAVGSQRIALTGGAGHGLDRSIRKRAPDIALYANLGAVQLVAGMGPDDAKRAVDAIGADALILHLNPLQEALQERGDCNWAGVEVAIEKVSRAIDVPVIAKEVGMGISVDAARRLVACGVAAIDVAGSGGSSWAAVEGQRASDASHIELGEIFRNWGIPTAHGLADIHAALPGVPLIASGGIRHGLDGAKAIRLGASLAGQAGALLAAAATGTEQVIRHVETWAQALRIACFATGAATLTDLKRAPLQ